MPLNSVSEIKSTPIALELAMGNMERLIKFKPNEWPYTFPGSMTISVDARWMQGWRGPSFEAAVVDATAKKVLELFDETEAAHDSQRARIREIFDQVTKSFETIRDSFARYPELKKQMDTVREFWVSKKEAIDPKNDLIFSAMEKVAAALLEAPKTLLTELEVFSKEKLKHVEPVKQEFELSDFEKLLLNNETYRRASMTHHNNLEIDEMPKRRLTSMHPNKAKSPLKNAWNVNAPLAEKLKTKKRT